MINRKFDIKSLPEIQDVAYKNINKIIDDIKENYKLVKDDAYKLLTISLNYNLIKSTIYYNLLFYVEISIKYYLVVASELNVEEVEKYGHDIYRLIEAAKQFDVSFEELRFLLDKIKDKFNKKVNLSKYYHYKYNKEIGETPLIFEPEISSNEMKNVKEVIRWISLHI